MEKIENLPKLNYNIISKITNYLPLSKNFILAKSSKNSFIFKMMFKKLMESWLYIAYPSKQLKIVRMPGEVEIKSELIPSIKFSSFSDRAIKNNFFYYNFNDTNIYHFQLVPFDHHVLTFNEKITDLGSFEVNNYSFWIVVNQTTAYKYSKGICCKTVTLAKGFIFNEILHQEKLYNRFFGKKIVIQDLSTEQSYSTELLTDSNFEFLNDEYILIDLFQKEKVLEDDQFGNIIDMDISERNNALFKYHLIDTVNENSGLISLEFVKFLPSDLKIEVFNFSCCTYWSKNRELRKLSFWRKEKEIGKVDIPDFGDLLFIEKLNNEKVFIEYKDRIVLIDVDTARIVNSIDMKERIPRLDRLGWIESVGYYFKCPCLMVSEQFGDWKTYILDQDFCPMYECNKDVEETEPNLFFD